MEFFIGQRVLYNSYEIVTTIPTPRHADVRTPNDEVNQWVRRASLVESYVALTNLTALPGGQL